MPQRAFPPTPFRMFEDFINDWAVRSSRMEGQGWTPSVDVLEKGGDIILRIEVPGLSEKEVDLTIEGVVLTIKGERKLEESEQINYHKVEGSYGQFSRSFTLPESVDTSHVDAAYKNGILTITLPQKQEVKPRSIKINS